MRKIIITGPGRSGTTFLVQLLTRLGLDTGYEPYKEPYLPEQRAGCEWVIDIDFDRHDPAQIKESIAKAPTVLKSPEWGLMLKRLLSEALIEVEHVIIPVRDLEAAARSRLEAGLDWLAMPDLPYEQRVIDQANVKAMALGRAIEACLLYSIPCTVMTFPLLVRDADYCYRKLDGLNLDLVKFYPAFYELTERRNEQN